MDNCKQNGISLRQDENEVSSVDLAYLAKQSADKVQWIFDAIKISLRDDPNDERTIEAFNRLISIDSCLNKLSVGIEPSSSEAIEIEECCQIVVYWVEDSGFGSYRADFLRDLRGALLSLRSDSEKCEK